MKNRELIKSIIKGFLFAFILLRPFIDGLTYPIPNNVFQLIIIFLAILWLFSLICEEEKTIFVSRTSLDIPILFFIFILLLSTSLSSCRYIASHSFLQFINYFLLYWLVVNNVEEKKVKNFLVVLLFSAVLISLYGIYQYFWGLEITRKFIATHYRMEELPPALLARLSSNRIFSTFVYPNMLAGYIVMIFPISIVMAIRSKSFLKSVFLAISALLLYCLFYTKSVGGQLSLFSIIIFFLPFYFLRERRKILLFGGVFLFLGLFVFSLSFKSGKLPHFSSFQDRIGYWSASFQMIKETSFFGSGPGTFGSRFARYKLPGTMETQHAHNNFLEVWAETGILGLLFFLWIWANFFRAAMRRIIPDTFSHCERSEAIRRSRCEGFIPKQSHKVRDCHEPIGSRNDTQHLKKENYPLILLGLSLSIFGFLVHSLGDFDLYNPSLAVIIFFVLALGVILLKEERFYRVKNNFLTKTTLFLIIVLITFLGWGNLKEILAERKAKESIQLVDKKEFRGARVMLEKALFWQPKNPFYWYRLFEIDQNIAFSQKDSLILETAIKEIKRAIFLNPYLAYYHYNLAKLYWFKAIWERNPSFSEEAISQLKEAIACYPTKGFYHWELGHLYEFVGEKKKAMEKYKEAEKLLNETTN